MVQEVVGNEQMLDLISHWRGLEEVKEQNWGNNFDPLAEVSYLVQEEMVAWVVLQAAVAEIPIHLAVAFPGCGPYCTTFF